MNWQAFDELPHGYELHDEVDLQRPFIKRAITILSILRFFFFGLFFFFLTFILNEDVPMGAEWLNGGLLLLLAVLFIAVTVLVHELIHLFFFWLFTRAKPTMGFRGTYAYAGMTGWYFTVPQMLVTALAPLVLISLVGVYGMWAWPTMAGSLAWAGIVTFNASGAIGDVATAFYLLLQTPETIVEDTGDLFRVYRRDDD